MDEYNKTRGSQIPAFGNWEYVNDLPITQYFECARQAGLIRYSSSSGECAEHHHHHHHHNHNSAASPDLYTVDFIKPPPTRSAKQQKGREKRTGNSHVKEGGRKQAGKVFDVTVTELPQSQAPVKRHPPTAVTAVKKKQHQFQYDAASAAPPRRAPKAVDEDLYKIPPELLKRKRRLGFFSRCLVPPCAV